MDRPDLWAEVDAYIADRLIGHDEDLEAAQKASAEAGLPPISVSPAQGRMLQLLAAMIGARRILEIGTLGGYSAMWMARALPPGGQLVTLEIDARHAEVARTNLARAGLLDRVEIRVGPALDTLSALAAGPAFDMVFIDADKENIPSYFDRSVALSRPGAVIVVDNVVRGGALVDALSQDRNVHGVRLLHEQLAGRADVSATTVQTVGAKGYDGFTLAVVGGPRP